MSLFSSVFSELFPDIFPDIFPGISPGIPSPPDTLSTGKRQIVVTNPSR